MLVVVAKYHDLEQANTKLFSEQFQPNGPAELQVGEPQWSLSIKLHSSKTNISWFLVSLKIFGNVGPYWRMHSAHTHKCFLKNRGTKWKAETKTNEEQRGATKYDASSCVLIPYWLPKECRSRSI
jgi:hypothetical protein